jgi:hypothetical protein
VAGFSPSSAIQLRLFRVHSAIEEAADLDRVSGRTLLDIEQACLYVYGVSPQ